MKKIILSLLLAGMANAQIINIPDANFKAKLIELGVDTNSDGEIDTPEALAQTWLNLSYSNIADLTGIEAFTNVTSLAIDNNQITSVDLSPFDLHVLSCENNPLTVLDLSTQANINTLYCYDTLLTSLDVTMLPLLEIFYCGSPNLSALALPSLPVLRYFVIYESLLTGNLDLSNMPFLNWTSIDKSHFTSIDVSNCPIVYDVRVSFSDELVYMNLKNGVWYTSVVQFHDCPNLLYVCTDDAELEQTNSQFAVELGNNPGGTANSYCSFVPGGSYNTISGTVRYDFNANGCDAADVTHPYTRVNISDGTNSGAAFLESDGSYAFLTQTGTFSLEPTFENAGYYNVTPATVTLSTLNNSVTQDFCISANGTHPDLEVAVMTQTRFRPGFDGSLKIIYHNKGTETLSGAINFTYDDSVLNLVSSMPAQTVGAAGALTYDFNNLMPFETREITVVFHLNSPTDTPAVNAGYALYFGAAISPLTGDDTPDDNVFTLKEITVNSLDPNAKQCLEGDSVPSAEIGKYLHYNIEFENIGTAPAANVVVADIIDTTQFDISSLQVLYSSFPVNVKITGNKVEFIFEGINLPGRMAEPIGGHGNVLFKLKTLSSLNTGDQVANTASIYFDYNQPIATNEARTTFAQLSAQQFAIDESVSVYPNPATDKININAAGKITSVSLFDIQGRLLETIMPDKSTTTLDISSKMSGIYFVKAATAKGSSVIKIIKQ